VDWGRLGAPLPVDLANTLRRRRDSYVDLIARPIDLAAWIVAAGPRLRPLMAEEVAPRLLEVRRFRDAVFALLLAAQGGDPLPAEPLGRLDALIPSVRRTLLPDHTVHEYREPVGDPVSRLLIVLAEATVEYLGDPAAISRLGWCVAPSCGRFFVRHRSDARWCSAACGTRARVARHAARRRLMVTGQF
jgi:predicted RNA-binding Zn ribbon-like protein